MCHITKYDASFVLQTFREHQKWLCGHARNLINNFVTIKNNTMLLSSFMWLWMSNKCVKFHVKTLSGCWENGKKTLGDTFLPHTVVWWQITWCTENTDAFPALIVPFFLNTGGSFDNFSTVVSGFGCSSVSMRTSPTANYTNCNNKVSTMSRNLLFSHDLPREYSTAICKHSKSQHCAYVTRSVMFYSMRQKKYPLNLFAIF